MRKTIFNGTRKAGRIGRMEFGHVSVECRLVLETSITSNVLAGENHAMAGLLMFRQLLVLKSLEFAASNLASIVPQWNLSTCGHLRNTIRLPSNESLLRWEVVFFKITWY